MPTHFEGYHDRTMRARQLYPSGGLSRGISWETDSIHHRRWVWTGLIGRGCSTRMYRKRNIDMPTCYPFGSCLGAQDQLEVQSS
jgi:hypothetical protein